MLFSRGKYGSRTDPKRFHLSGTHSNELSWKKVSSIDVAYDGTSGGIATFGRIRDKSGNAIAGIKVFNRYDDPVNNPKLCAEEYDILCRLNGGVAPAVYMIGEYDWAVSEETESGNIRPAIVMELLPGNELLSYEIKNDVLSGGTRSSLSAQRVMELALSIAYAIEECYNLGIVHRDLSPNNIFVHVDEHGIGKTRLIDFGSATYMTDELNYTMGKRATPHYAAPEMCAYSSDKSLCPNGERFYDQRKNGKVDVWSFGAILYCLYTGKAPHKGLLDNQENNYIKIKREVALDIKSEGHPDEPRDPFSSDLRELILNCTKFYPEHRYSIEEAISSIKQSLSRMKTPPPPSKETDGLEKAVGDFSDEMGMGIEDVYGLLDGDGRDVAASYVDILDDYKWNQISAELAHEFGFEREAFSDILLHARHIEAGAFPDTYVSMRTRFASLFDEMESSQPTTVIAWFAHLWELLS